MKKWYLKDDLQCPIEVTVDRKGTERSRIAGANAWTHNSTLFDTEIEALEEAERQAKDYLYQVQLRQLNG